VKFGRKPPLRAGELVHLTLEDGRVLNCRVLDESPYCAVIRRADRRAAEHAAIPVTRQTAFPTPAISILRKR
jgi:hypothetical protein